MLSLNALLVYFKSYFGVVAADKRAGGNHVCSMRVEACYYEDGEAQWEARWCWGRIEWGAEEGEQWCVVGPWGNWIRKCGRGVECQFLGAWKCFWKVDRRFAIWPEPDVPIWSLDKPWALQPGLAFLGLWLLALLWKHHYKITQFINEIQQRRWQSIHPNLQAFLRRLEQTLSRVLRRLRPAIGSRNPPENTIYAWCQESAKGIDQVMQCEGQDFYE